MYEDSRRINVWRKNNRFVWNQHETSCTYKLAKNFRSCQCCCIKMRQTCWRLRSEHTFKAVKMFSSCCYRVILNHLFFEWTAFVPFVAPWLQLMSKSQVFFLIPWFYWSINITSDLWRTRHRKESKKKTHPGQRKCVNVEYTEICKYVCKTSLKHLVNWSESCVWDLLTRCWYYISFHMLTLKNTPFFAPLASEIDP